MPQFYEGQTVRYKPLGGMQLSPISIKQSRCSGFAFP